LINYFLKLSKKMKYFIGFLFCCALMTYALYAQYVLNLEPCPLCIFQRLAVIAMGIIFLLCSIIDPKSKISKLLASFSFTAAASIGIAVASRHVWLQNLPSDQVPGCGPGLDFMLSTFPLAEVLEMVLSGSGECANVDWSFLSLSMPSWVIISFFVMLIYAIWTNYRG
jgi:disulfide bond formation protein DsbB|tara:strand:- start:427 stop:930 length:504 start_codon:yes stop_codon:yes gene_type:complete